VNLGPGGACRHLLGRVIPLVLIAAALSAVLLSGSADAAAAPTPDPIIGDWNVKYGAPATVTMTLGGSVYTETAKTPVRVTGGSCDLPAGTVIATFSQTGPGTYAGQHGLWFTNNCSFSNWTDTTFSLNSDGNSLSANLGHGYETTTFTKIQSSNLTG
jgi:hypothetical protein